MHEIVDSAGFSDCLAASRVQPVFVFKHSTTCPISAKAHSEVEAFLHNPSCPPVYVIRVIESRQVSNEAAKELAVEHRSPQLILIRDGKAVWMASHHGIHGQKIAEALVHGEAV